MTASSATHGLFFHIYIYIFLFLFLILIGLITNNILLAKDLNLKYWRLPRQRGKEFKSKPQSPHSVLCFWWTISLYPQINKLILKTPQIQCLSCVIGSSVDVDIISETIHGKWQIYPAHVAQTLLQSLWFFTSI